MDKNQTKMMNAFCKIWKISIEDFEKLIEEYTSVDSEEKRYEVLLHFCYLNKVPYSYCRDILLRVI